MWLRENGRGPEAGLWGPFSYISAHPTPTAGAEWAAQIHRPLGLPARHSLGRAGGGSVLLMSTLLFCKNILITNCVDFDFYGEKCKRDIYLF